MTADTIYEKQLIFIQQNLPMQYTTTSGDFYILLQSGELQGVTVLFTKYGIFNTKYYVNIKLHKPHFIAKEDGDEKINTFVCYVSAALVRL